MINALFDKAIAENLFSAEDVAAYEENKKERDKRIAAAKRELLKRDRKNRK